MDIDLQLMKCALYFDDQKRSRQNNVFLCVAFVFYIPHTYLDMYWVH